MKSKFLALVFLSLFFDAYSQNTSSTAATLAPSDKEGLANFTITDAKGIPEESAVILIESVDKKFSRKLVADIDGKCQLLIPEGLDFTLTIQKFGEDFKYEDVYSITVKPGAQIVNYNLSIELVTTYRRVYTLNHLYFGPYEYDVAGLKRESVLVLDQLVDTLKVNPKMKIEVAGHTDNSGDDKTNLHLSQKRADSIRDYLIRKGIAADRILAKGYGKSAPIASNDTPEGRSFNRRTEVKVIEE